MSHLGIALLQLLGRFPLAWSRSIGAVLGHALFFLARKRRRVVQLNLAACFPDMDLARRSALSRQVFVRFAQSWVDRGWLWQGNERLLRERLHLCGMVEQLSGRNPTLVFAPHFVGMDAGGIALALHLARPVVTIYTRQKNTAIDRWAREGRTRVGDLRLFRRDDGPQPLVAALRRGDLLYLLPDMNFGERESLFVPFFGVPAATVTSLSRFARLGRARVVPVVTSLTPEGYEVRVHPAWENYPTPDRMADTLRMNQELEKLVLDNVAEYFWVHRRFKSRPAGSPPIY